MAKILLLRTCFEETPSEYTQTEFYYNQGYLEFGRDPIQIENKPSFSCSVYALAEGTELEKYCVGTLLRKVKAAAPGSGNYYFDDQENAFECISTGCNVTISTIATDPSGPGRKDGSIRIFGSTSASPLTFILDGIGTKTVEALDANFTFSDLPAGIYTAKVVDGNNCVATRLDIKLGDGEVDGTSKDIDWLKYDYYPDGVKQGYLQGLAWDKASKRMYDPGKIAFTYPAFDQYKSGGYKKDDIVAYVRKGEGVLNYYQAAKDLKNDPANQNKITYPDQNGVTNGSWIPLTFYRTTVDKNYDIKLYEYDIASNKIASTSYSEFFQGQVAPNGRYYQYDQGAIVRYDFAGFYRAKNRIRSIDFADKRIPKPSQGRSNEYWEKIDSPENYVYVLDKNTPIDQYVIGNFTRRVFFHAKDPDILNDTDYIYYDDVPLVTEAPVGSFRLLNIIINDIDEEGKENGSVWVEADSPNLPILYHMRQGVRAGYQQDNNTGIFSDLPAGIGYVVDIYDAKGNYLAATFDISDKYRTRWKTEFTDVKNKKVKLNILQRDYKGEAEKVCLVGNDALRLTYTQDSSVEGNIPSSCGSVLDFELLVETPNQFAITGDGDDREIRVDYYHDDLLLFRGYIDTKQYKEKMAYRQAVSLSAFGGPALLNDTLFQNHLGKKMEGRRNLLSTLFHCISKVSVNFPVYTSVNLKDVLMQENDDPLQKAYAFREVYYDQKEEEEIKLDKYPTCREVINAILTSFHAQLYQKNGAWYIEDISSKGDDKYRERKWNPNGELLDDYEKEIEYFRILNPEIATDANEMMWRETIPENDRWSDAYLVDAKIKLKQVDTLILNSYFKDWNQNNLIGWNTTGNFPLTKGNGEKVKDYALRMATRNITNSYLVSSQMPHLNGKQERIYKAVVKYKVETNPTNENLENKAILRFETLIDGKPYGQPTILEVSSKDKWKEQEFYLPFGFIADKVALRMKYPEFLTTLNEDGSVVNYDFAVLVDSIQVAVSPGTYQKFPEEDYVFENNPKSRSAYKLPTVELTHADIPLIPTGEGKVLPTVGMDAFAFQYALTLEDFTPTTAWKRPGDPAGTERPLLNNAVADRLALRVVPINLYSGKVTGPGTQKLMIGDLFDAPQNATPGKFLILNIVKSAKLNKADIVARRVTATGFGDEFVLPENVRVVNNSKRAVRVSNVNGIEGYRVVNV